MAFSVIIERVGIGRLSPTVSMRGAETVKESGVTSTSTIGRGTKSWLGIEARISAWPYKSARARQAQLATRNCALAIVNFIP
jgi:hypothetical protein